MFLKITKSGSHPDRGSPYNGVLLHCREVPAGNDHDLVVSAAAGDDFLPGFTSVSETGQWTRRNRETLIFDRNPSRT